MAAGALKKNLVKLLLSLALVGLLAWLGRPYYGKLKLIGHVSVWMWVVLGVMFALMRGFQGEVFYAALRKLGAAVTHYECFMLSMIISLTNLILPRVGMGAPALYMKKRHNFPYAGFVSLLLPTTVLQLICIGAIGLLSQAWLAATGTMAWDWYIATALSGLIVVGLLGLLKPPQIPAGWNNRLANFLRRLIDSWSELRRHRGLVLRVLVMQIAVLLTQALRLWVCYYALGVRNASLPGVILASLAGQLAMLAGITPGGFGLREHAITRVALLSHVASDPGTDMAVAMLDRIVMTVVTVGLAQVGIWHFYRPTLKATPAPSVAADKDASE